MLRDSRAQGCPLPCTWKLPVWVVWLRMCAIVKGDRHVLKLSGMQVPMSQHGTKVSLRITLCVVLCLKTWCRG